MNFEFKKHQAATIMYKFYITLSIVLLSLTSWAQETQTEFFDQSDAFFKKNVSQGKVDYVGVKNNQSALNGLISYLDKNGVTSAKTAADKALLINAYNIFVIKGVLDNYPTQSPLSQANFFDVKKYSLSGQKVSLNQIEKEMLIAETGDARLHFVLVCGALGCPKIASFAYRPEPLEQQMDIRTSMALNDDSFIKVDEENSTVAVSEIFSWYNKDFTKDGQTVIDFINEYRIESIPSDYRQDLYTYDWTLNEQKKEQGALESPSTGSNLTKFTPSKLFGPGQFEIQSFNSIYTQTSVRNKSGDEISGNRGSIFSSRLAATFGVSKNSSLNLGLDLVVSGGATGDPESGIFQIFGPDPFARSFGLTAVNFRLKFVPIKRLTFYSVQVGLQVPVNNDIEGLRDREAFLALNRYVFNTQFFYDFKLTNKLRLFYEFDFQYLPRRNEEVFFTPNFVDLPSTAILTYFPSNKVSLFVLGQYFSRYGNTHVSTPGNDNKFGLLQSIVQLGGGAKYQLNDRLGFELSYGNFVSGRGFQGLESGAGELINFGIRYIK